MNEYSVSTDMYARKIKHSNIKPNNLNQVLMILTSNQEMPGSNLKCVMDYTEYFEVLLSHSVTWNRSWPLLHHDFKFTDVITRNPFTVFIWNSCRNGAWSKVQSTLEQFCMPSYRRHTSVLNFKEPFPLV